MPNATQIVESKPYGSSFDPSKNYVQVLNKPGVALQSRELIEAQTISRNQLALFAGHVFSNGSRVTGGGVTTKRVDWIKLLPSQNGVPIVASEWKGRTIHGLDGLLSALPSKAKVIEVVDATDTDLPTLYLEYLSTRTAEPFPVGCQIRAEGSGLQATAASTNYYGQSMFVGINDGTYFVDGYFVKIVSSSVICKKYDANVTGSVGFEYSFKAVTHEQDEDLLDTAAGPRNAGKPGADRLSVDVKPRFIDLTTETAPSNFISVLTFEEGMVKTQEKVPVYSDIAIELGRRTEDQSGSYTVRPFRATTSNTNGVKLIQITHSGPVLAHVANAKSSVPHRLSVGKKISISGATGADSSIYNGTFTVLSVTSEYDFTYSLSAVPANDAVGDPIEVTDVEEFSVRLGAGKAYVRGFEIETISDTTIDADRARSTAVIQNFNLTPYYGGYLLGSLSVAGAFSLLDETATTPMELRDNSNAVVGSCSLKHFRLHSGSPTSTAAVWKAHVYDVKTIAGKTMADVYRLADPTNGGILVLQRTAAGPEILEGKRTTSIFRAPRSVVKTLAPGGTSDTSYSYRKKFSGAVSGGSNSVSFNLTGTETFVGPVSSNFAGGSTMNKSYLFFDVNNKTAITPTSLTIASGAQQITANFATSGITVTMVAEVARSQSVSKTKSSATQTLSVLYSGNLSTNLGITDVYEIVSVTNTTNSTNITSNFKLDTGQRDSHYGHASIVRIGGVVPGLANGNVLSVVVKRFVHTGSGFFSADSYANVLDRDKIPRYVSSDGETFDLADCIDFRSVRADNGTALVGVLPPPDSTFVADVEFYLPRRDRVVLSKSGIFGVVKGTPSPNPMLPAEPSDAMTLYELYVNAYTADPVKDVTVTFVENKRYTMRDIGRIDKRVDRLEYYTALSFLESATASLDLTDDAGLDRFKNGILVDPLTGHKVGDVRSGDYRISIDPQRREMRAPFVSDNVKLTYAPSSSAAMQVGNADVGSFLTVPYTERDFLTHPYATKAESVNPYLVTKFVGAMQCNPPSDDWMDTNVSPAVNADLTGDLDAWNYMFESINANMAPGYGTQWGDWQTTWTGVDTSVTNTQTSTTDGRSINVVDTRTTTANTSSGQIRRGDQNVLGVGTAQASIGEKIVDVNIVHGMRSVSIRVSASGMRPNTNLHVFVDDVKLNAAFSPDPGYLPTTEGCVRTSAFGKVYGTLVIPANTFRTGERVICLMDEPNKVEAASTTHAKFVFACSGISVTKQDTIVSTRVPQVSTRSVVDNRVVRDSVTTSVSTTTVIPIPQPPTQIETGGGGDGRDPLAQTFIIPKERHENGVFLSSVDVFFRRKASSLPVWVEVLPTVNGFPHASKTVPLSYVEKLPSEVNIPSETDDIVSIRNAPTRFTFPVPIYLEPGVEYALKVQSNDSEYECYVAELGQRMYGSNQVVLQSSLGSLFKSQNSRTWTPVQEEDLMLTLRVCRFDTNVNPVIVFTGNSSVPKYADTFQHDLAMLKFDSVNRVGTSHKMKDKSTSIVSSGWNAYQLGQTHTLDTRKVIDSTAGCVQTQVEIATSSEDVAPLIDLHRNSLIIVANQINYYGLKPEDFEIFDAGSGANGSTTVTVVGGGGTGAVLAPIISAGKIIGVDVIEPGNGYISEPTVTVTGAGSASVFYKKFETSVSGGNALARYMTRRTTLADEFVTNFVQVMADVYKPNGTAIEVFIKCVAQEDPTPMDQRPWVKMNQVSGFKNSASATEFVETSWTPAGGSLSYTNGGITYPAAKTFAVKIVHLSVDTTKVPLVRDLRVISGAP